MADQAIVIGVGHYPKLGGNGDQANDLPGAIADADAMAEWLAVSGGANVTKITSTGHNDKPWQIDEVRPRLDDVNGAFVPFVTAPDRIGDRLYVYMAGHGIAPEPRSRCLILADAVASVRPWIPNCEAPAWIDWFANQTQFDEFVLWMDCCGTQGLEYMRGRPFVANTVTRAQPDAKVFMAFASGNGRAAYEGPTTDGIVRGFFTDQLLKGLKGDAVDANGEVRSGSLASYLRNGAAETSDGQSSRAPARPLPEIPLQHDMLFATRPIPEYQVRIRDVQGATPPDDTLIVATSSPTPFSQSRPVIDGWARFNLPVGLFKLTGPNIQRYVEIGAATPGRID